MIGSGSLSKLAPVERATRGSLAVIALYFVLYAAFVHLGADGGLITPGGGVDVTIAALGLAVLTLRVLVLFVVTPVAVYRLTMALAAAR